MLSAKKKIARNHREGTLASVFLLLLLSCACVTPIDATAAGMNLKQFNFYSTRRVNCLLVEKRQPGLGSQTPPKKKRKREKKRRERGRIFCDTSAHHNKNVPSRVDESSSRRRSETKFYREREKTFLFFYDAEKGKRKTKESARVRFLFFLEREREREERDSFVVVVSLTSFTSSSPGHHP